MKIFSSIQIFPKNKTHMVRALGPDYGNTVYPLLPQYTELTAMAVLAYRWCPIDLTFVSYLGSLSYPGSWKHSKEIEQASVRK